MRMNSQKQSCREQEFDRDFASPLREDFLKQVDANPGSSDLASRIRQQLENRKPTLRNNRRLSFRTVVIGMLTSAAVALIAFDFSPLFEVSDPIQVSVRVKEPIQVPQPLTPVSREDAEHGLKLLNFGLGKTVGSMETPDKILHRWTSRLLKKQDFALNSKPAPRTPDPVLDAPPNQLVAVFAGHLLGIAH